MSMSARYSAGSAPRATQMYCGDGKSRAHTYAHSYAPAHSHSHPRPPASVAGEDAAGGSEDRDADGVALAPRNVESKVAEPRADDSSAPAGSHTSTHAHAHTSSHTPASHTPAETPVRACSKCGNRHVVAAVRGFILCAGCLCHLIDGRVRRSVCSSIAAGQNLALAYSGTHASTCMLKILRMAMDVGRRRRVCTHASVIIIDTSCIERLRLPQYGAAEAAAALRGMAYACVCAGFCVHVVSIASLFSDEFIAASASAPPLRPGCDDDGKGVLPPPDATPDAAVRHNRDAEFVSRADAIVDALMVEREAWAESPQYQLALKDVHQCFQMLPSIDAAEDVLRSCKRQLLLQVSRSIGASVLLTCETVDKLAMKLFVDTCAGRGSCMLPDACPIDLRWGLPTAGVLGTPASMRAAKWGWYETHTLNKVAEIPDGGVVVLRPMLDTEQREVALYCAMMKLPSWAQPTFTTLHPATSSIKGIATGLLTGLQMAYPQTVHAIVRTARKLRLPDGTPTSLAQAEDLDEPVAGDLPPLPPLCAMCGAVRIAADVGISVQEDLRGVDAALSCAFCPGCRIVLGESSSWTADTDRVMKVVRRLPMYVHSELLKGAERGHGHRACPDPTEDVSESRAESSNHLFERMRQQLREFILEDE